jgi:Family of unknown function (DUF6247)
MVNVENASCKRSSRLDRSGQPIGPGDSTKRRAGTFRVGCLRDIRPGYGVRVCSASVATNNPALPPLPLTGAKPREIRATLHPEYREEFDRDYQEALDEAGVSLDLEGVFDTLEHWRMRSGSRGTSRSIAG